jgi:hypothetical protein
MITFMISVRLHEFNTGVLQPSSLKEISSQDYKHRGGYKRGYTRITADGETLGTWNGGNPRSPM